MLDTPRTDATVSQADSPRFQAPLQSRAPLEVEMRAISQLDAFDARMRSASGGRVFPPPPPTPNVRADEQDDSAPQATTRFRSPLARAEPPAVLWGTVSRSPQRTWVPVPAPTRRDGDLGLMRAAPGSAHSSPRYALASAAGCGGSSEERLAAVMEELARARSVIDYQERLITSHKDVIQDMARPAPPPPPVLPRTDTVPASDLLCRSPQVSIAKVDSVGPAPSSVPGSDEDSERLFAGVNPGSYAAATATLDCDFDSVTEKQGRLQFRRAIGEASGIGSKRVQVTSWDRGSVRVSFRLRGYENPAEAKAALDNVMQRCRDPVDPLHSKLPGPCVAVEAVPVQDTARRRSVVLVTPALSDDDDDDDDGDDGEEEEEDEEDQDDSELPRRKVREVKPLLSPHSSEGGWKSSDSSSEIEDSANSDLDMVTEDSRGDEITRLAKQQKEGGFMGWVSKMRLKIKFLKPRQMTLIRRVVLLGIVVAFSMFLLVLAWKLRNSDPTMHSTFQWLSSPPSPGVVFCPHPLSNLSSETSCGFANGKDWKNPSRWIATCGIVGPIEVLYDDGAGARPSGPVCYAIPPGSVFWNESRPHPWLFFTLVMDKPTEFFTWGMYTNAEGKPLLLSHSVISTGAFSLTFVWKEKRTMLDNLDPSNVVVTPEYDHELVYFRECMTCQGSSANPHHTKPDQALTLMIHPRTLWKEIILERPAFTWGDAFPALMAVGTAVLKLREVLVGKGKVEDPYNPWGVVQKVFVNVRRPLKLQSRMVRAVNTFFKTKVLRNKEFWKVTEQYIRRRYCKSSEHCFSKR